VAVQILSVADAPSRIRSPFRDIPPLPCEPTGMLHCHGRGVCNDEAFVEINCECRDRACGLKLNPFPDGMACTKALLKRGS
jgi:hypothetical protein